VGVAANDNRIALRTLAIRISVVAAAILGAVALILGLR